MASDPSSIWPRWYTLCPWQEGTGSGIFVELGTDRISFPIKQQEWERFAELLDRPPRDNPGLEKLFSKPGVFTRAQR